jgi:hypothetical protein
MMRPRRGVSTSSEGVAMRSFADFLYYGNEITDINQLVRGDIVQKYVSPTPACHDR